MPLNLSPEREREEFLNDKRHCFIVISVFSSALSLVYLFKCVRRMLFFFLLSLVTVADRSVTLEQGFCGRATAIFRLRNKFGVSNGNLHNGLHQQD